MARLFLCLLLFVTWLNRNITVPLSKPNIVFILLDDADARVLQSMSKLQALVAQQGMTFNNFIFNAPLLSLIFLSKTCPEGLQFTL